MGEPSPYTHPNSWFAPVSELHTRGLEHLTQAINGPLGYRLATLDLTNFAATANFLVLKLSQPLPSGTV